MIIVNRLGVPTPLQHSLACTNSIKNVMATVRRVCRNVKRWPNVAMTLRWTAAGIVEAATQGCARRSCEQTSRHEED
jgi:putative transposase